MGSKIIGIEVTSNSTKPVSFIHINVKGSAHFFMHELLLTYNYFCVHTSKQIHYTFDNIFVMTYVDASCPLLAQGETYFVIENAIPRDQKNHQKLSFFLPPKSNIHLVLLI